ncbi:FliM/FliN family flagellar motor switch protein [Qipengyuania nanhaisediminis]|uniref:FliM/FliN family flagellar motor switch protein n=1 Tax=Qipengyuania nanhaisediminis TaxID=604088 RepID=UPI0038B31D35
MNAFNPALHRFGQVTVRISVELGRTQLPLKQVLALEEGSVVTLDRLTDELLDVTANGKVIAHGEVIAQDGRFALRIVSLAGDDLAPGSSGSDAPAGKPADSAEGAGAP